MLSISFARNSYHERSNGSAIRKRLIMYLLLQWIIFSNILFSIQDILTSIKLIYFKESIFEQLNYWQWNFNKCAEQLSRYIKNYNMLFGIPYLERKFGSHTILSLIIVFRLDFARTENIIYNIDLPSFSFILQEISSSSTFHFQETNELWMSKTLMGVSCSFEVKETILYKVNFKI